MRFNEELPDIIGLDLKIAIPMLENAGILIREIKLTKPPHYYESGCQDYFRVLRVDIMSENKVKLIVCDPLIDFRTKAHFTKPY